MLAKRPELGVMQIELAGQILQAEAGGFRLTTQEQDRMWLT